MKRFYILMVMLYIGILGINYHVSAQTLEDYRKTQADVSLTYDNNWNPIGKFSIKNLSNKTITNVEIIVYYTDANDQNYFEPTTICRTQTKIAPNNRGILTFYINNNGKKPKSFALNRIRYADGTVCDK